MTEGEESDDEDTDSSKSTSTVSTKDPQDIVVPISLCLAIMIGLVPYIHSSYRYWTLSTFYTLYLLLYISQIHFHWSFPFQRIWKIGLSRRFLLLFHILKYDRLRRYSSDDQSRKKLRAELHSLFHLPDAGHGVDRYVLQFDATRRCPENTHLYRYR